MSFQFEQGLFNLEFTDYHAILGVAVDAELKDIRKRYLSIARRLHPDSCATEDEADRQRASEFLSKLVNPAYEKLSQERNHTEHQVMLKLKAQQALRQQETVVLTTDAARRLASVSEVDQSYRASLKELADAQYQALDQTLEKIGQISELNLVYLMRKQGKVDPKPSQLRPQAAAAAGSPARPARPVTPPAPKESPLAGYVRRAQEFEAKQEYGKAILELREALHLNPTNSHCHSRLGVIYMKLNQNTMAKIHFNQALKLNPQDPIALEGKRRVDPNGTTTNSQGQKPQSRDNKPNNRSGGLFGLFGGKKK